ncbi:metal ABC transporter permease [uncultured Bacteroides sp.]|uniref:metal ABC transporter permease n=1 Tax=uncultured Bacteroides sp. TaxID=162156 RepID=UPI002593BE2D|nr:metal ABC transporter permease [uncultured Bacteroides sp.]
MTDFIELFQYTFFQNALLGSLFASIACGIIGTYIVTRRLVFISGGITHASFGGIGIGLYTGISPLLTAAIFSVLSAFGVEWLSKRSDMREDSAIAVFWTFGMAVGIIFSFLAPGFTPELSSFLFGNILTITPSDIILLGIISLALTVFFAIFLRPIVSIAFDREFARSQRLPVTLFEYTLMMFIALTIVACLRMIGIVLVISLLTLPQMTANLFTYSFKKIIWLSILIGYISCLGGLILSYQLQVPSGASIIFTSIVIYAIAKIIRRKS